MRKPNRFGDFIFMVRRRKERLSKCLCIKGIKLLTQRPLRTKIRLSFSALKVPKYSNKNAVYARKIIEMILSAK